MGLELIEATFEGNQEAAAQQMHHLKSLENEDVLKLDDAVAVSKTPEGEISVEHLHGGKVKKGAVSGAIVGALIGLVGGPGFAIVGGALGAAGGGLAAKSASEHDVPHQVVDRMRDELPNGSSALVAFVETDHAKQVAHMLEQAGGRVLLETIDTLGPISKEKPEYQ